METIMTAHDPAAGRRKLLPARRLALLASVAGLGAAVLFAGPGANGLRDALAPSAATAQTTQRIAGFADVVAKVKPAVVSVRVKMNDEKTRGMTGFNDDNDEESGPRSMPPGMEQFFRRFGMPMPNTPNTPRGERGQRNFSMSQGSGFFISADGYVVTNNHVVSNAKTVEITTDDGKSYDAKVVGSDAKTDLALLKVDGRSDFPFVTLNGTKPRIGDWVIAVGNPFGLGGTVTAGIISADGRDIGSGPYDDFIQIDAPVNRGNSGGPAFDANGNVIGVTTAIFSPSGGSVGIGFAIPADTVKNVVAQLKDGGHVTRAWIGVQIQPVTKDIADSLGLKEAEGALVAEPQPDAPAAKAGIKAGDVIVSVNGQVVKDARGLAKMVAGMNPDSTVELGVLRDGARQIVPVKLAQFPEDQKQAKTSRDQRDQSSGETGALGLTLAPADGAGAKGVVVTGVNPNGPAAERGFRPGDIILEVAGKPVSSPNDVRKAMDDARSGGKNTVLMRVKSEQGTRFVALPAGKA
ncbi:MAG: Do family serine endopeptidase [Rhizobiales bacterium]|nr:Do family serine endopeptidase [Hyphomicrobiales bacterium]